MDDRLLSGLGHPPSRPPSERTFGSDTSRLAANKRPASPGILPTANPLSTSRQTDSAPWPSRASAMPPPKTPPIQTIAYSSSPHLHFNFGWVSSGGLQIAANIHPRHPTSNASVVPVLECFSILG